MSKKPIGKQLSKLDGFPQSLSNMWGKIETTSIEDCSKYDGQENEEACNAESSCNFDKTNNKCENSRNYDAVFTYGYDNKTYYLRLNVYLYDDSKRRIASGYPRKIDDVFKGVPSNITAVFTWGKDGKTYFFKGPLYYKYDDKSKKVESGYPQKSAQRWKNMPLLFESIFTLNETLDNDSDSHPTYVISGEMSYYIDPISDTLKNKKLVSERFTGLNIIKDTSTQTSAVSWFTIYSF